MKGKNTVDSKFSQTNSVSRKRDAGGKFIIFSLAIFSNLTNVSLVNHFRVVLLTNKYLSVGPDQYLSNSYRLVILRQILLKLGMVLKSN